MDEEPTSPSAAPGANTLDARRRRVLFRATHRGTKETDRLIGGFVAPRIAGFTDDELAQIERIMELPDIDLADWLMGRTMLPPEHDTKMMRAIGDDARPPGKT